MISIIPAALIAGLSYNGSKKALKQETFDKLITIRDEKKQDIEDYLKSGMSRISYMAQEPMVKDAMMEFTQAPDIQSAAYNNIYQKYHPTFLNFVK
jgi:methyl-accepting chemotaxis protein